MNFAPLHNHTEYSDLDGLSKPEEIATRCKEIGCSCCGITDHQTVAGHLEFAKVMYANDIKPIFGCELYHGLIPGKPPAIKGTAQRDQAHLVAGALTDEGLRNLWRLADAGSHNHHFVSRCQWADLERFKDGLFVTSACISGTIQQAFLKDKGDPFDHLNKYIDIFGDNFFIEIHTYPGEDHERLNNFLVDVAWERGVPLVYATDAHFASPDQYEIHDAYVAMKTRDTIFTPIEERQMWHPKALYIQSEEEIRANLSYLPQKAVDEALANSGELADRCDAHLPEVRRHLPAFIPRACPWTQDDQKDLDAADLFLVLIEEGVYWRYGEDASEEVWERAEQEARVFLEAGLEHYFLQAWDFTQFCEKEGIRRGPGRGSAPGAITAYLLGITDVDPIHYGLSFERFYNAGREKGFPDIDNDFPRLQRKRLHKYMAERWGENKVRVIGTITRMKPKAALERTQKVCAITNEELDAVKAIVDRTPEINILDSDAVGWAREYEPGKKVYVWESVGDKIENWVSQQPHNRVDRIYTWLALTEVLCSRISGYGLHPSGVVVSDVDLADELPCDVRGNKDDKGDKEKVIATMFPMSEVDLRQFIKQDFLGLRNLDTLDDWEAQMDKKGFQVEWSGLDKQEHPDEMWELLDRGLTLGVFQIEDGYGRQLCKEIKPRSVEQLAPIVAINRPGPIRSGATAKYLKRLRGDEEVTYDHPILEDLLEPTYGLFVYQEQVINYFNKIGYSKSDADAVRKILGKKKPADLYAIRDGLDEWKGKSYATIAEAAGLDEESAQIIWDKVAEFALYSFNKSHAIAYAILAFRTIYAKYYGSAEFIMACIRTNEKKAGLYVGEGRRMDIQVLPPDIYKSEPEIAVIDDHIYFGFSNVKHVGVGSGRYLCQLRKRYDLGTPDALADALEYENKLWEGERDEAKAQGRPFKKKSPKQTCPANRAAVLFQAGAWDNYLGRDITLVAQQKLEKELLGVILTDNCDEVFAKYGEYLDECDDYSILEETKSGDRVLLPGVINTIVPKTTRKDGKAMGIITVEYLGAEVEFAVFPKPWRDFKPLWRERTPAIFTLKKNERGIHFEDAIRLS